MCFLPFAYGAMGAARHPAFPAPSSFSGGRAVSNTRVRMRRGVAATCLVSLTFDSFDVIPGRREAASPESITMAGDYGFRAPSLRSGPGMTCYSSESLQCCG
jgi:hypothetical protein